MVPVSPLRYIWKDSNSAWIAPICHGCTALLGCPGWGYCGCSRSDVHAAVDKAHLRISTAASIEVGAYAPTFVLRVMSLQPRYEPATCR